MWPTMAHQQQSSGLRIFKALWLLLVVSALTLHMAGEQKRSLSARELRNDFLYSSYRNSVTAFLYLTLWAIHLHRHPGADGTHLWMKQSFTDIWHEKRAKTTSPPERELFPVLVWASGRNPSFSSFCWPSWCGFIPFWLTTHLRAASSSKAATWERSR